jgi:hypothetical protein
MVGTTGGAVLLIVNIVFAGLLGVGAGSLTSLLLHRPWGLKAALLDAILAVVVGVVAAYVVLTMDNARGVPQSRVGLVLAIAAASVVVMHLMRLAVRSSN